MAAAGGGSRRGSSLTGLAARPAAEPAAGVPAHPSGDAWWRRGALPARRGRRVPDRGAPLDPWLLLGLPRRCLRPDAAAPAADTGQDRPAPTAAGVRLVAPHQSLSRR